MKCHVLGGAHRRSLIREKRLAMGGCNRVDMISSLLSLVSLLGSMLQDPGELVVVEHAILDGRLPVHLVHIVVGEPVSNCREQLPQSVFVDQANIVLIETTEGILDDVLRVCALQSLTKQGEEHGEVDWTRGLVHHRLQVILGGVLAQGGQHVVEVLVVDEPVPVVVDHVEGLLELLDLVLVEHGKDIAGCPLSPLLCSSTTSCGLSGGHLDF